jgi:hypothetical protein
MTTKKTVRKKSTKKQIAAGASKVIVQAKKNAEKSAQPGIISDIMTFLTQAQQHQKPLTVEELLAKLSAKHPKRDVAGMQTTVRAQLSRLPREKEFGIEKLRDGRNVRYMAAS